MPSDIFTQTSSSFVMDGSLAELRTDWLTGRSVLVAENRAERPNEFEGRALVDSRSDTGIASLATVRAPYICPFCAGHEDRTPKAAFELGGEQGQWQVRVVPNKYPAVSLPAGDSTESVLHQAAEAAAPVGAVPATGAHEVIIESSRHVDRLSALSVRQLRDVLHTYAARLRHWRKDGRFEYGLVFKNQGARAGASIAHLHSQLIALPKLPASVAAEVERAGREYEGRRECPYCQLLKLERTAGERIVHFENGFIAFCPFASVQPYEVWLLPVEHWPSFDEMQSDILDRLAAVFRNLIVRVEAVAPEGAYNMLLRTGPWRVGCDAWSHWRIELLPRSSSIAGFELASGVYINSVAPERAASKLRSI
jgi:UDPglucose--hexose-1-phosphate uridylyltransferase